MDGGIVGSNIGSISGVIDGTAGKEFLAIELSVKQNKTINGLACSFMVTKGQTQLTKPFLLGRVIVVRKLLQELQLTADPYQDLGNQDLLFDQFFTDYRGIVTPCFFTSPDIQALSVILFPAFCTGDLVNPTALYGSLNIQGAEETAQSYKLRPVN